MRIKTPPVSRLSAEGRGRPTDVGGISLHTFAKDGGTLYLGPHPTWGFSFLVCTNGAPVADMLAHSHPLPLSVEYFHGLTKEDEEGKILALKQCRRVRRICLFMPFTNLEELIVVEEYPILETLAIVQTAGSINLMFSETLHAPRLRHLLVSGLGIPTGSRFPTTFVGLVTLCLIVTHPPTYFHPNTLLQWVSLMSRLETLEVFFLIAIQDRDLESLRHHHTPDMTPVTLPSLHRFNFQGACTYSEALVHRIVAPRLDGLQIFLQNQHTFSVSRLLEFMNTTDHLKFDSAKLVFSRGRVHVEAYPHEVPEKCALHIAVGGSDKQLSSMAQISTLLSQIFSAVKHLTLGYEVHPFPLSFDGVDRGAEWRKLLRSFSNVETLRIDDELVGELSRCLQLEDREFPLELVPKLQELTYSGSRDTGDAFTSFINARQNAGRPVILVRPSSNPDPSSS